MEIKHLNTFLVLSEVNNFTKTAEQLGYVQSSVTTQIQKLEAELNVRLFERIGKCVSLTPEGKQLVPYARKLVALSKDITCMCTDSPAGGILKIGASESIGIFRLPAVIKAYKDSHPHVELHLEIVDSKDFVSLLASQSIDIGFTLDKHICDSSVVTTLEMGEKILILACPDHPLAMKDTVKTEDFEGIPFILTGNGCCYRELFERELAALSITPRVVLETSSIQVIKETAMCGLGVCVLPQFSVKQELLSGQLVRIPYVLPCNISTQLIYHKDKYISHAMKDFICEVKKLL